MSADKASDRAAAVERVMQATANESPEVKAAAVNAVGAGMPPPGRTATDIAWIILVSGLVVLLVLAVLGLTHVIGHRVGDQKILTVITATLAGLLGLFVKTPGSS